jgi:VWFA-related protein
MGKTTTRPLTVLFLSCAFLASFVHTQELKHEVSVVNISVPVRVFDGDRFVDSLKLEDFELAEDGKPQTVLAAYLIQGTAVKRREGPLKSIAPVTHRHFVLLFQVSEYVPELNAALELFFDQILRPGDSVELVTPAKTYRLAAPVTSADLRRKAKQEFISKVRQDILVESGLQRSILRDLISNLEAFMGALQDEGSVLERAEALNQYATNLDRLNSLREVDLSRLQAFAEALKKRPGAKHVFFFFQKERIPQLNSRTMSVLTSQASPEETLKVQELMSRVRREAPIDREAIQKAFSDASVDVHFLYLTRSGRDYAHDIERQTATDSVVMAERYTDVYNAFRDISTATGGTANASANPTELLKKAAEAAERYYLLYYQPLDYSADGKFHTITVKVRSGNYRVTHRAGYIGGAETVPVEAEKAPRDLSQWSIEEPAGGLPEVETIAPDASGGVAPAESLMRMTAAYCRRLQGAALRFSCREEVREHLSKVFSPRSQITRDTAPEGRSVAVVGGADLNRVWVYDYLLVRRGGGFQESRVLVEENGSRKRVENARLATARFEHSDVLLGPVGLLGEEAQRLHSYAVAKEVDLEGEPGVILDVQPKGEAEGSLYGKAWVRIRDGAVLKIEWAPASMGNYRKIEDFARAIGAKPKLAFTSEYAVEKNGLRFPSAYGVTESYSGIPGRTRLTLSKTDVVYTDYKFFQVETEVRF